MGWYHVESSDGSIGKWVAVAVGLGAIIGAGIFVLSGTAIALAGPYSIIAFIVVGVVALIVALEIGELATINPSAKGASYSYVRGAFGSELGFITGITQYFSYATSVSAIALGFGTYLSSTVGMHGSYAIPLSIVLILVLSYVNVIGVKKAAKADSYLVMFKLLILFVFVAFAAIFAFYYGHFSSSNFSALPSQAGIAALFGASIAIFFAFSGFQTISTITSKIRGGPVEAARAIFYSVCISIVVYLAVVIAMMLIMPASRYTITADPLSTALTYASAPQWLHLIVNIGALVATTSACLAMIMGSSRVIYQISKDGLLPKLFRNYDKRRDASSHSIIATMLIGIIMLFSGNIYIIAAISNFGLLFTYIMSSLAIVHFRRAKASAPFRVPYYPYLTIIAISGLLLFMVGMPREALTIGVMLILTLIVVYYALREAEGKKPINLRFFK